MASSTSSDSPTEQECVYETWMILQRKEVIELEQAAVQAKNGLKNENELTQLIEKTVENFQDYANNRSRLARIDVSPLLAPTSCTSLENSILWIAGCRPSSLIRFAYALCGMDIESHLTEFLSSKLASLQEDAVDQPFAGKMENDCENADDVLDEHSRYMADVLRDADELRMKTLKEIVLNILKPLQAVEYLAAAKRLKHCYKIWGQKRDHRRTNE